MDFNYNGTGIRQSGPQKADDRTREIDARIRLVVPQILKGPAFADKKVADNPTDALDVTNRRFVTMNGSVAGRPSSSVAAVGQFYLDTQSGIPMWYTTAGWRNGVGSIVALNS